VNGFRVQAPGVLSLFQDGGRFGHHALGLTTGGPMDGGAFYWANRLVENPEGTTAMEVAQGGIRLECTGDTTVAVTGADVALRINGRVRALWCSHRLGRGDSIELGHAESGMWAYLAVAGGFGAKAFFGSTSVVLREGLGEAIQTGQQLTCGESTETEWAMPRESIPLLVPAPVLRVTEGGQKAEFSAAARDMFFGSEFTVSQQSNRMGCRLNGPAIASPSGERLSEGTTYGTIQVPPNGQPIVLLNDRQTIGGYPKLGVVLSLDCWKLAQCRPGATVSFKSITVEEAQDLVRTERAARENMTLRRGGEGGVQQG